MPDPKTFTSLAKPMDDSGAAIGAAPPLPLPVAVQVATIAADMVALLAPKNLPVEVSTAALRGAADILAQVAQGQALKAMLEGVGKTRQ